MPYKDNEKKKEAQRRHYAKNKAYYIQKAADKKVMMKAWLDEIKASLKCLHCPEDDSVCLDFHHRDPKKKEIQLSAVVKEGWGKDRILKEIDKCDVLCSNCHKKLHAKLNNI